MNNLLWTIAIFSLFGVFHLNDVHNKAVIKFWDLIKQLEERIERLENKRKN